MAASKPRRLKVFQAQFGFHDSVVAATSQAAALRAWGTHQNLFAEGRASVASDAAAVEAALAHPDVPLRRAVGSSDPFQVEPTGLPAVPDAPKRPSDPIAPGVSKAKPMPPPDRSRLDAAERALRDLDEAGEREETALLAHQRALEAEIAETRARQRERHRKATAAVMSARDAYRKAGGKA